jgi:hypothetical protein
VNRADEVQAGFELQRQLDRDLPLAKFAFGFERFIGDGSMMPGKTPRPETATGYGRK